MSCVPALTLSVQKLGQTFKWLLMVNQMAATACGQTVWRSPGRHVTDGSSERVTVDNVSWGQKSTFSTITQNEIRKNLKLLLYHFRDIVYKPTHTQCRETRMPSWTDKFHTHRKRQAGTQQPTPWLTDAQSIFISTFSDKISPALSLVSKSHKHQPLHSPECLLIAFLFVLPVLCN